MDRLSSLPGGAADKLSNLYEVRWTAYRFADVLVGKASRMRLEPPGATGEGVEFEIVEAGQVWVEQVKDAESLGRWTLHQLVTKNVIGAIRSHLAAGKYVRLVLSTDAEELKTLTERVRATLSYAEFAEIIGKDRGAHFGTVRDAWQASERAELSTTSIDDEAAWGFLGRLFVEHHTFESLRRLVAARYERLVAGDPEGSVDALRGYFDEHLHQPMTAQPVWDFLADRGYSRRYLAGDDNTILALDRTVQRHARQVAARAPAFGFAADSHADRLADRLQAPDCRQVVICDGRAGAGKSTVVMRVVELVRQAGWPVAVMSMDGLNNTVQSAAALGRSTDLRDSPAILLAGVADGASGLLIVDQLDAVSTVSGRMSDAFYAVSDLLDQLCDVPDVKVLLVARTLDVEQDPRLGSLVADANRVERFTIETLSTGSVEETLTASGTDPAHVEAVTLELLRVPLHLAVFSRLSAAARTFTFRTRTELFSRYTDERRLVIEQRVGHLDWDGITGRLCQYMSDHEVLRGPVSILASASRQEVAALESYGLLIRDGDSYAFFHETYFDFIFAQAFVASGEDLVGFLLTSGQYLFRRAQARQILEYLASSDRIRFRRDVVRLLTEPGIRSHLRDVVVGVLERLDVVEGLDWESLEPVAWGSGSVSPKVRALLARPLWFDAADHIGRWEGWLNDPSALDLVFRSLMIVARERPGRVDELVRPFVGASDEWRQRLNGLVSWSLTPGLVDLAIELLECGQLDDARGPVAVNSDFWSLMYFVLEKDADSAARLAGAYLMRQQARAVDEGSVDPFASGHISDYSSAGGASHIMQVAEAAPEAFTKHVLPFVAAVGRASAVPASKPDGQSGPWAHRWPGTPHTISDAVFAGIETALRLLATTNPDAVHAVVAEIARDTADDLRFLVCRTYTALGHSDEALEWLLSDDHNLYLGWNSAPHAASRQLIETTTPICSTTVLDRLTSTLREYYPEWELSYRALRWRGRGQYELLSAVAPQRLTPDLRRRLAELERKFPGNPPTAPREFGEVQIAAPPVAERAAVHLTNKQWRRALAKYNADTDIWRNGRYFGGVHELAQLMGRQAAEQPQRFTELALTFDRTTPAAAIDAVIRNVANIIDLDALSTLCRHAQRIADTAVGRTVCYAIRSRAAEADDELVELVTHYAHDPDPDQELARTSSSGSSGQYFGGDLYLAGINSTRGEAATAAAAVLQGAAGTSYVNALIPALRSLATDKTLAVRTCAAEAVLALFNHDPASALDIADQLFNHDSIDVHDASSTERLLANAMIRDPGRYAHYLQRTLDGPPQIAQRAGKVWAFASTHQCLDATLPAALSELNEHARSGAAKLFAQQAAHAVNELQELFDDPEPQIRRAAAAAMRSTGDLPVDTAETLIAAFLTSAAFDEHMDQLVSALGRTSTVLPTSAIEVCERAVQAAGREFGDIRSSRALTSGELVSITLRLYRQGDQAARERCMDVIDNLAEHGAYGLTDALDTGRWTE